MLRVENFTNPRCKDKYVEGSLMPCPFKAYVHLKRLAHFIVASSASMTIILGTFISLMSKKILFCNL